MYRPAALFLGFFLSLYVSAASLVNLSTQDANGGLKDALIQGAELAVRQLGQPGGFSANPEVRIALPGQLGKASRAMKMMGMGAQVDQLENSMNLAAEAAVPQAQALLVDAIRKMTVEDARAILAGPQDSATRYLDRSSRQQIRTQFLPIVKQATDQVGVAQQYNTFAGQAARFGAVDSNSASIENYVTEQALDGLFTLIAQQEASLRQNPASAATSLAKRVFEAIR